MNTSNASFQGLTKYKQGSLYELMYITFPLIISGLSHNLLIFVDRTLLSHYSTTAFTASAAIGTIIYFFYIGLIAITGIAEVFVGRNNGARTFTQIASPVWQMIWLSLSSVAFVLPVIIFGSKFIIPTQFYDEGGNFFKILMLCTPIVGINTALCSFFAGIGKPHIITISSVIANILNFIFDYILIFGIYGHIEAMGATGAALGSAASMLTQSGILIYYFLNTDNNRKYSTRKLSFNFNILKDCLKLGYPNSVGHMIEIGAWAILFKVAAVNDAYVTVLSVGQSIFILFVFLSDGVYKATTVIASNIIGAKQEHKIAKLLTSAFKFHLAILIVVGIPMLGFPKQITNIFDLGDNNTMMSSIAITLRFVWLFIAFDGISWILAGILTAVGETKYIMWSNASTSWIFSVIPVYIATHYFTVSQNYIWLFIVAYPLCNFIVLLLRYNKIKHTKLLSEFNYAQDATKQINLN